VYFNRFAPTEEPTGHNIPNLAAAVTFRIQYTVFLVSARILALILVDVQTCGRERGKQPLRRRDPLLLRNLITHAVIPLGSHVRSWQEYEWAWPMGDLCLKGAKHDYVRPRCAGYRQLCTMTYVHNSSNSSFNLWKLGEISGAIDDFHALIVSSRPSEIQK